MKKISFVLVGLLFIVCKATAQSSTDSRTKKQRPNVLFILVDDLGRTDVNIFDPLHREYYKTPNIDRLAKQGMMFTQAYSNAANCTPSRAAIMSGQRYPHQPIYNVGTHPNSHIAKKKSLVSAHNASALPLKKVTLAEALKQAGYKTAFMGKWGIGDPPETGPEQQGFNINIGGYIAHNPNYWDGAYYKPNNNPYIHDAQTGEYLTDYLTRKAQGFIQAHQNEPFYLQLSYYTVHQPLQAKKKIVQKYKKIKGNRGHDNPAYAAMIESLDQNVGKLMHTLKKLGIAKNTIVVFFSDNGGVGGYGFLDHASDNITDNSPFKGGKTTFYEGGIRVPMIIRWPKAVTPGTKSNAAVTGLDIYPTLLAAANVKRPKNYLLDGESLLPLLKNPKATLNKRPFYWHFPGYPLNVWRTGPVSIVQYGKWKLMKFYESFYKSGKVQLYNLNKDISEVHNVSSNHHKVVQKLLTRLEIWLEENDAPMPTQKPTE